MTHEHLEKVKTISNQLCKLLGDVSSIIYFESDKNNHNELDWLSYLSSNLQTSMKSADEVIKYCKED